MNKYERNFTLLITFAAVTALLYPTTTTSLVLASAAVFGGLIIESVLKGKLFQLVLLILLLLMVFLELISGTVAIVVLTSIYLATSNRPSAAVVLLLPLLSSSISITAFLAQELSRYKIEFLADAIVFLICFAFVGKPKHTVLLIVSVIVSGICGFWGRNLYSDPFLWGGTLAVIVAAIVSHASLSSNSKSNRLKVFALLLFIFNGLTWLINPPSTQDRLWVLLPNNSEAFESKFFKDYVTVLRFSGFKAEVVTSAKEIPKGSTVFLPWLTAPLGEESSLAQEFREKRLKIIVLGEHSNFNGIAERIQILSGTNLLNTDLTVPDKNTDWAGHVRTAGLVNPPYLTILNRLS